MPVEKDKLTRARNWMGDGKPQPGSVQSKAGTLQSPTASCIRFRPGEKLLQCLVCKVMRKEAYEWRDQKSKWAAGAAQLPKQIPNTSGIPCTIRICFASGLASFLS